MVVGICALPSDGDGKVELVILEIIEGLPPPSHDYLSAVLQ